jgi:hypothetical protein
MSRKVFGMDQRKSDHWRMILDWLLTPPKTVRYTNKSDCDWKPAISARANVVLAKALASYRIQEAILGLLKNERGHRMQRLNLSSILFDLDDRITTEVFEREISRLERKRRVRIRNGVVILRIYNKPLIDDYEESMLPGVGPGDVFRIFGNSAKTILTDQEIKEALGESAKTKCLTLNETQCHSQRRAL